MYFCLLKHLLSVSYLSILRLVVPRLSIVNHLEVLRTPWSLGSTLPFAYVRGCLLGRSLSLFTYSSETLVVTRQYSAFYLG